MKYLLTILGLFLFATVSLAQSNEGTNLWCGFLEHRNIEATNRVVVITSKEDATGTVSMPLLDWSKSFSVTETVLDAGDYTRYRWQDNTIGQQLVVAESGNYWVEVTDEFGCTGTDDILLIQNCETKFFIPTIFSPNGDNQNDEFTILGGNIQSLKIKIFNRWGELVFENNNQEIAWNGLTNKQELAPTGVYIYRLDFEGLERDGDRFESTKYGTINLVR